MPECEVETFLAVSVDLNCISPELSRLGITKTSLMSPPLSLPEATTVTNKAVIDLETYLTLQGLSKKTPRKWLYSPLQLRLHNMHWTLSIKLTQSSTKTRDATLKLWKHFFLLSFLHPKTNQRAQSTSPHLYLK
ncbi:hypothetical protein RRG08_010711 [Elysia crispata]|uniref:Uncharacterized protein n=1 Tax=Elysia crispata TaxID=231223 RepID=A0AAE1B166_9GAST|nr:hypothetical protein RRG08_010711 [Elysia crispata]